MNVAIDKLKQKYNSEKLQLIGYSGGGAVVTLVASQRSDVISLVTIAGNLDHQTWTKHHKVSPLTGSYKLELINSVSDGIFQKIQNSIHEEFFSST